MAKQQIYQQRVLKLSSEFILWNKKNVHITLQEARDEQKLIPLFDSDTIRKIDIINEFQRDIACEKINELKLELKEIRRKPKSHANKKRITEIYQAMDNIQCKMDYVTVVMKSSKDFDELNKGFKINDIEYHRLIGTPNGVKKSTIIYCSIKNKNDKMMYNELSRRLNNGRDKTKLLVPAKFEAHKALSCSASTPVSLPKGVLVVTDLIVHFKDKIIYLNDENSEEPIMKEINDADIELNICDGGGLMMPSLAARWSEEMHVNYLMGACCLRNSFCKGVVSTFDFQAFGREIAKCETVKDIWGNVYNINDVELILTESMLKLWDSYSSIEDYLDKCKVNDYAFSIAKVYPNKLEEERNLNYQFIQSYDLSDDDINRLIMPTVSEIKDVLGGDYYKTLLFMKGSVDENYDGSEDDNVIKSLMIAPELLQDTYIISRIQNMINKKIDDAKIGTLKIKGNYCVVIGDPYALCQHIFDLKVSDDNYGLLKAGEIYNKHWNDKNVNKVVCFRAPMSCHNNIRKMNIVSSDNMEYWYQYLPAVNILNCHDTLCMAENGMDTDGDCLITTNNDIMLNNAIDLPAIMCIQRKAKKRVITEEELVKANKNSFGDAIGSTTNKITAMFDVRSLFSPNSKEYKELSYRIICGQLYQQNAIDATKGIIAKPMPKTWYNNQRNKISDKDSESEIERKNFYQSIVADKKPYFMNYIYPQQMAKYQKYIKNANIQCLSLFGVTISDLLKKQNKNEEETAFTEWYRNNNPVTDNNCVMNRLCHSVENEFEGFVSELKSKSDFNYTILKSGIEYKEDIKRQIIEIYKQYIEEYQRYVISAKQSRTDSDEVAIYKSVLVENYRRKCIQICPNEVELCDILLDICYTKSGSKKFVWDMCGEQIVRNLLAFKDNQYTFCVKDDLGDIEYGGKRYKAITKTLEVK